MKEKRENKVIIHVWKSMFLNYYEDYVGEDEDIRDMAETACMLIPKFLNDFGLKCLKITRVDFYNWNIDWKEFKTYMDLNHPYLKVDIFSSQIDEIR